MQPIAVDVDEICRPWCGFEDCECLSKPGKNLSCPPSKSAHKAMDRLAEAQKILKAHPNMGTIVAAIERTREDLAVFIA